MNDDHEAPGFRPEQLAEFRQAQLLLLLATASEMGAGALDIERIAYYEFFSANPFLVFTADDDDRRRLALAGFDPESLSYQSSAQRFSNRRARLQFDVSVLVTRDLVMPQVSNRKVCYAATDLGQKTAGSFAALYAESFREAAALVIGQLKRLSDSRLRESAKQWLRAKHMIIDLYDSELAL